MHNQIACGALLELRNAYVQEPVIQGMATHTAHPNVVALDGDVKRLVETNPLDGQGHRSLWFAAHALDRLAKAQILGGLAINMGDAVTSHNSGACRWPVFNGSTYLGLSLFHANFNTQTTKAPLGHVLHLHAGFDTYIRCIRF